MKNIIIIIFLFVIACASTPDYRNPINKGMGVNSGWIIPSK